jgi:hypothetical protein
LILGVICIVSASTSFKVIFECNSMPKGDTIFQLTEWTYVLILLFVAIFAVLVFLYSARFFPGVYLELNII